MAMIVGGILTPRKKMVERRGRKMVIGMYSAAFLQGEPQEPSTKWLLVHKRGAVP